MTEDVPVAGHNNPPKTIEEVANDLFDEAKNFLDGEPIESEGLASEVTKLKNLLTSTKTKAEKERKIVKQPSIDEGRRIEKKYTAIKDKLDMAAGLCRDALKPYLLEQERIQEEKAKKVREEAEEAARVAKEELDKLNLENLEDLEKAREIEAAAEKQEKAVKREANKKTNVSSSFGRAASIKTRREAVVVDFKLAVAYFWKTEEGQIAFREVIETLARKNIDKEIPGIEVREIKEVT